ncbi:MAG: helix-turn-helix domain-containing protein [Deltaproteobacteria bacterium]|nr:helix-turn-helix domain-containing protein [Deltaproteobacteria bacterium]
MPPPRSPGEEMKRLVQPDGLTVRRRRHERGWSLRDLVLAIESACFSASGLRRTLTPNQIEAIEERAERISYDSLLLLADGLDCDPADLLAPEKLNGRPRGSALH